MLQELFSSKVRVELLGTFFLLPHREVYVRELERLTHEDYKSINRELLNLERIGLLSSQKKGNQKYFRLNPAFLLYEELRAIFLKTRGAALVLKEALKNIPGIEFAFIYGSIAAGTEQETSDIDIMVLGKIFLEKMLKHLREPEERLKREINPTLFPLSEFRSRIKKKDSFITEIMSSPKIMVIGDEDELRRVVKTGAN